LEELGDFTLFTDLSILLHNLLGQPPIMELQCFSSTP